MNTQESSKSFEPRTSILRCALEKGLGKSKEYGLLTHYLLAVSLESLGKEEAAQAGKHWKAMEQCRGAIPFWRERLALSPDYPDTAWLRGVLDAIEQKLASAEGR